MPREHCHDYYPVKGYFTGCAGGIYYGDIPCRWCGVIADAHPAQKQELEPEDDDGQPETDRRDE